MELNMKFTEYGYLRDYQDWDEALAMQLAADDQLELGPLHWMVLDILRTSYIEHGITPPVRLIIKKLRQVEPNMDSCWLQQLFPKGVLKQGSKLAGLPKPARCL